MNIANTQKNRGAGQLARYLHSRYPGAKFFSAYEAGFCGTSAHHDLCKAGIHNMIIHPADLSQTDKQKKTKTDLHDSRAIARYQTPGRQKFLKMTLEVPVLSSSALPFTSAIT